MWDKLKHEWKTASWGTLGLVLEGYDQVVSPFLATAPIVDPKWQWVVHIGVPIGFFALRRWKDKIDGVVTHSTPDAP